MNIKQFLWLTPFISFICGYYILHGIYHVEKLPTPSIVGQTLDQAVLILSPKNINIRIITQQEDVDLPDNTILSQTPQAGSVIKPHQALYVVLSKKPDPLYAPNLINTTVENIKQQLAKKKIRPKFYYLPSPYPTNHCFAQKPTPGTALTKNKIICYITQQQNKPIILPTFINMPLKEVTTFLEQYPVTIEILHKNSKDLITTDTNAIILNQRPLPGSFIMLHDNKPVPLQLLVQ